MLRARNGAALFAVLVSTSAFAASPVPTCSKAFVKRWNDHDRRGEIPTPSRPSILQGDTGRYLCDRNGCSGTN